MGEAVLGVVACFAFLVLPMIIGGVLYYVGRNVELKARESRSRIRP